MTGKLGRLLNYASNVRELTSLCSCWGKLVLKKHFRTAEVQLFEVYDDYPAFDFLHSSPRYSQTAVQCWLFWDPGVRTK